MKILITGATGQLGSEFKEVIRQADLHNRYEFVFTSTRELDLLDLPKVSDFIRYEGFDWIFNFAAYTAVDKAEQEPDKAYALNRDAVFNMVEAAEWIGAKFVHISTDYVFDGTQGVPYREDDKINPLSVYGKSKAEGEEYVIKYHSGMVIRTSWLYSRFGHNFVKTMLRLGQERRHLRVVYDQIGTPTNAYDLAQALVHIFKTVVEQGMPFPGQEIFHITNEGVASWYDFAKAIFDITSIRVEVEPIETKDFPTPAQRPHFSVLNKTKFKEQFKFSLPYWRESLSNMLNL